MTHRQAMRNARRRLEFEQKHPNAITMKDARNQIEEQLKVSFCTAHNLIHSGELPLKITRLNPRVVYVEAIDSRVMT